MNKNSFVRLKNGPIPSILFIIGVVSTIVLTLSSLIKTSHLLEQTVMITNADGSAGGSGAVISVNKSTSQILTNAHVCNRVTSKGVVHTYDNKTIPITRLKKSETHDLCLVEVAANLKYAATISNIAPSEMDEITVVGHPQLLPAVSMRGQVSKNTIAQVGEGIRKCTVEELQREIFCLIFGGMPVIKVRQATVLSAIISPGSSGSAVYNSSNELVAVVFAGAGEMSYGLAVPYEYVINFVYEEAKTLGWE